jgi:HlyD family secretion protein
MKILKIIKKYKKISILALILISIISFATIKNITKKNGVVTHETISAQKDILINVISGTGQVFALDQIEVKPKIAGKISYINIKNGQKVNRGDLLLQLDSEAAEKDL